MELDGKGTFIATRSSIINENRNPDLSEKDVESILQSKFGIEKFIWLDGQVGMDITDFHIDGFVKFYEGDTIITMQNEDLIDWDFHKPILSGLMMQEMQKATPISLSTCP